jgi:hypothetical protein
LASFGGATSEYIEETNRLAEADNEVYAINQECEGGSFKNASAYELEDRLCGSICMTSKSYQIFAPLPLGGVPSIYINNDITSKQNYVT